MTEREKFELLRLSARSDFGQFLEVSDRNYRPGLVHRFLSRWLADRNKRGRYAALSMPPQHGKSRLVQELCSWLLGSDPALRIAVVSYAESLAVRNSERIRDRVESPLFQWLYPECKIRSDKSAKSHWETTAGGGVKAVGVGSGLTGFSVDVLIIDDPHKDAQEAYSEVIRGGIWDWFGAVALTRLSARGEILVIQTRWHLDDLTGRLLDKDRINELKHAGLENLLFNWLNLPALAEHNDPLGRAVGETLWPENYPTHHYQAAKATLRRGLWSALYQGSPIADGGNQVSRAQLPIIEKPPTLTRVVRFWDLATTVKRSSDYTVGCKAGIDAHGNFYVLDITRFQNEWPQAKPRIAAIAAAEKHFVGVESVGGFIAAAQDLRDQLKGQAVVNLVNVASDKLSRASGWLAAAGAGKVSLLRGAWNDGFLDEAEAFPLGKHDDQVDAVSGAWAMLQSLGGSAKFGWA